MFSERDPAVVRWGAELEILAQTDAQYVAMAGRLAASPADLPSEVEGRSTPEPHPFVAALAAALVATVRDVLIPKAYGPSPAGGSDADGLFAHIALTVAGVTLFVENTAPIANGVSAAAWRSAAAAALEALSRSDSRFVIDIESLFSPSAAASSLPTTRIVCQLGGSQGSALLCMGLLVASHYWRPAAKLYSVFFMRWCASITLEGRAAAPATAQPWTYEAVLKTAVRSLVCLSQRGAVAVAPVNEAALAAGATGGLMLGALLDGGVLQAEGVSAASHAAYVSPATSLPMSREASVAMASRAALEAFVEFAFVAGPLQWGTATAAANTNEHPLVKGRPNSSSASASAASITAPRKPHPSNNNTHPTHQTSSSSLSSSSPSATLLTDALIAAADPSDKNAPSKRRRTEGGGKDSTNTMSPAAALALLPAASPRYGVASWDALVREVFPLFLSQGGFEFPWHSAETLLRDALTPSAASSVESKSWGPTASRRIDDRRASVIISDSLAIIAKEVAAVGFAGRLGALTRRVAGAGGVGLREVCRAIETYEGRAAEAARAHAALFGVLARRQAERGQAVASGRHSFAGAGGKSAAAAALEAMRGRALEDMESAVREGHVALGRADSVVSTPAGYDAPVLFTVLGLVGAATPMPKGSYWCPPSGAVPTVVDAAGIAEMAQIKVDLLPGIIELRAAAAKGASLAATPAVAEAVRARATIDVLLMAVVRLTQLRHTDHVDHLLSGAMGGALLPSLRGIAARAGAGGVSAAAVAEAQRSLRSAVPTATFPFAAYLVDGSEAAAAWSTEALDHCRGYTPLSALMAGLFGGSGGVATAAPSAATSAALVSPAVLCLEAFADRVLLRIASTELCEAADASLPPLSSLTTDLIAWCLTYSATAGLAVGGPDPAGFVSGFSFAAQGAMRGAANASTAAVPYVAISAYLNPIVVDHPTRGYALRRVLWAAGELLTRAVLRPAAGAAAGSPSCASAVAAARHAAVEGRRLIAALDAFGLLEWSNFGAAWGGRFGSLLAGASA